MVSLVPVQQPGGGPQSIFLFHSVWWPTSCLATFKTSGPGWALVESSLQLKRRRQRVELLFRLRKPQRRLESTDDSKEVEEEEDEYVTPQPPQNLLGLLSTPGHEYSRTGIYLDPSVDLEAANIRSHIGYG